MEKKNLMPHVDLTCDFFKWKPQILDSTVVFTNDKNMDVLKGYKAQVRVVQTTLTDKRGEIQIFISGLSLEAAGRLFGELEAMKQEDVDGDNGQ